MAVGPLLRGDGRGAEQPSPQGRVAGHGGARQAYGPEHPVFLRIGERDGAVFVDLGDAEWRAIEVTPQGWRVIDRAPVKFIRSPHIRALPTPEDGGLIEQELRDLVNVQDEADFKLIVAWILGCFHPRGPYPILAINGAHGSAKSTLCRLLRRLTDPHAAEIRLPPRNEDDLIVAARNSHVLAFDNMSDVPGWLSDALCTVATGTGFGTREHYSNTGEVIFKGARPIMLNGIPDLGSRSDFGDRKIDVVLKPIAETNRRAEVEYWREIERRLPLISGAILDAIASALRHRDEIPPLLPRMADFAVWVSAAEPGLGWEKGAFLAVYTGNRKAAVGRALEADVLGEPVCKLVENEDWLGSPTELLTRLADYVSDAVRKGRAWPAVNKLRGRLRFLQSALRERGIELDIDPSHKSNDANRTRLIGIRRSLARS
jgi:hypothetical protein